MYESLVDALSNCEAFIEEDGGGLFGDEDDEEEEEEEDTANWLDGALAIKHKSGDELIGRKIRIDW